MTLFAEAYGAEIEWLNDPQEWSGNLLSILSKQR